MYAHFVSHDNPIPVAHEILSFDKLNQTLQLMLYTILFYNALSNSSYSSVII